MIELITFGIVLLDTLLSIFQIVKTSDCKLACFSCAMETQESPAPSRKPSM